MKTNCLLKTFNLVFMTLLIIFTNNIYAKSITIIDIFFDAMVINKGNKNRSDRYAMNKNSIKARQTKCNENLEGNEKLFSCTYDTTFRRNTPFTNSNNYDSGKWSNPKEFIESLDELSLNDIKEIHNPSLTIKFQCSNKKKESSKTVKFDGEIKLECCEDWNCVIHRESDDGILELNETGILEITDPTFETLNDECSAASWNIEVNDKEKKFTCRDCCNLNLKS